MGMRLLDSFTHRSRPAAAGQPKPGFTMVELMVVLLILGILIAMTAAIATRLSESGIDSKTKASQAILIAAVNAFNRNNSMFPPDPAANGYVGRTGTLAYTATDANSWPYVAVMIRNNGLLTKLLADSAAAPVVRSLATDAIMGDSNAYAMGFLDGRKHYMDYRAVGGAAARPVIIAPANKDATANTVESYTFATPSSNVYTATANPALCNSAPYSADPNFNSIGLCGDKAFSGSDSVRSDKP